MGNLRVVSFYNFLKIGLKPLFPEASILKTSFLSELFIQVLQLFYFFGITHLIKRIDQVI